MTLADLYEACVRDLADLDAYRLRLLGRADTLRELCDAGLAQVPVQQSLAQQDDREHEDEDEDEGQVPHG